MSNGVWTGVCTRRQLIPERGVAVLVGEVQVALFRITRSAEDGSATDFVYAVGHKDPACDANVMARGIVGSIMTPQGQRDTVASPMYKDVYDLVTGACLTRPELRLPVYRTWVAGGVVYVEAASSALASA
ncbi:MAG: nitrite reductase small subunit NirD [Marmoricola sp.]